MKEKPTLDPEESIVSLSDVKRLYISVKKRLYRWTVLGGVVAFLLAGYRGVKYKAEASFKEGIEQGHSEHLIRNLMGGVGAPPLPQAASFLKSNQVLKPLIEKIGLQIELNRSDWAVAKFFRRYREAWRAERGAPLSDPDPFVFENVRYAGEAAAPFCLLFSEDGRFVVFDERRQQELGQGVLGEEIALRQPEVAFTLAKIPKKIKNILINAVGTSNRIRLILTHKN